MGKETVFGNFMGDLFYMGSNDQIMQEGRKSFTNAFSSNLNSVNLKICPGHSGRTLENKSKPFYSIMGGFILTVNG